MIRKLFSKCSPLANLKLTICAFVVAAYTFTCNGLADAEQLWVDSNSKSPKIDIKLPSFAPVIDELGQSVVSISVEGKESIQKMMGGENFGGQGNPPFEFFMPPNFPKERRFASLGSGFVIHPDGYIVTNNHVVDQAEKIYVTFRDDKERYQAKILGKDAKTDLALLKIEGEHKPFVSAVFGNSDEIRSGDWVIAIGNPFRLGHTATVGIVSAKSRKIPGGGPYDDFIQTDASINMGNSGGPLFNAKGEVIGVNTLIFSPNRMGNGGVNIGIGFAIPVNIVKTIIQQLYTQGKVTRGWLGVLIQQVTPELAQSFNLKSAKGALVADVMKDSPASKAGIQRGDTIVKFDGKEIQQNDELPLMVANTPVGKEVTLVVMRKSEEKSLVVKIEELKDDSSAASASPANAPEESKLGIAIQNITPDLAKNLGLETSQKGVIVTRVGMDSIAALSGIRPSDIIVEVNSQPVADISEFRELTKELDKDKPLLFLIQRGDSTIFVTVKVE